MTRSPLVRIELDRWDWSVPQKIETVDITNLVKTYTFQRTIKTPESTAVLEMLPQNDKINLLDDTQTYDVIRIYEFGNLKFQGAVQRIAFSGYIDGSGLPQRYTAITVDGIEKVMMTSPLGLGLGFIDDTADAARAFLVGAKEMMTALGDLLRGKAAYSTVITTAISKWMQLMRTMGGIKAATFLETYLDYTTYVDSTLPPAIPRTIELFTGAEQSLTLWQLLSQLVEAPQNELWCDSSQRQYWLSATNCNRQSTSNKTFLVFRQTPFDGTIRNGVTSNPFSLMPEKNVQLDYLTRYDLSKSLDEVYTVYDVIPPAYQLSDAVRALSGTMRADSDLLGKYLLRTFVHQPFYFATSDLDAGGADKAESSLQRSAELAQQFINWFKHNDQYLSGAIVMMVPDEKTKKTSSSPLQEDVYIGERVSIEGIQGSFYAEGIAHRWSANNTLTNSLSITRGYDYLNNRPIKTANAVFRRGLLVKPV